MPRFVAPHPQGLAGFCRAFKTNPRGSTPGEANDKCITLAYHSNGFYFPDNTCWHFHNLHPREGGPDPAFLLLFHNDPASHFLFISRSRIPYAILANPTPGSSQILNPTPFLVKFWNLKIPFQTLTSYPANKSFCQ